mgnify:CR=1 FL=1
MKQGIVVSVLTAALAVSVAAQSTELMEAIEAVRAGRGVPQAAAYDPALPGPHRLVIVTRSGEPHDWTSRLPPEWIAKTVSELALVVVVDAKEVDLGSRSYSGGPPITRYRHDLQLYVRGARSGVLLGDFQVKGGTPEDFSYLAPQPQTRIDGRRADSVQLEAALNRFVQPLETPAKQEMQFVWIEPGTFAMGVPESEEGRTRDERQHRVTLTKGYWMQTTEVTQSQWVAVMGGNPSEFQGDSRPVENVSWDDVQRFIHKLNAQDPGKHYRLPTEAEWEYACRAGTTGERYGELDDIAWHRGNSNEQTHPVGRKQPNAWGLYDMIGNVWEWCADFYDDYPSGAVTDPAGPSSGSERMFRGGCFENNANSCRSTFRNAEGPGFRSIYRGFRLVRGREDAALLTELAAPQTGGPTGRRETNRIGMIFVELGSGSFTMGSPMSETERDTDETLHRVTLTKGYWMQTTEVTQGQWRAVMGSNPSNRKWGDDYPVESANWNEVQDFICKLNAQDPGKNYRLPTEAEWEYACRGGTTGARYGQLNDIAWHLHNRKDSYQAYQVGQKQPNAWGLYDMIGNVEEWCYDWYDEYPSGSVTDPTGPPAGSTRVVRGGGWGNHASDCRSADRNKCSPNVGSSGLGFRLARSSP